MSISLYTIADDYRHAFNHLTELLEETDFDAESKKQIVQDSLSDLIGDFETKALNVAGFINNIKLELEAVKTAEIRFINRKKTLENKIQYLSDYLFIQCLKTGSTQIKSSELIISIKNNPPKVIIDNENSIPDIYKKVIETVNISKSAIATAIKNGLEVNGAHLESSQRLDIK